MCLQLCIYFTALLITILISNEFALSSRLKVDFGVNIPSMTFKLPSFSFPKLKLTAVIHRPKGRPAEPMKLTLPAISLNAQSGDEDGWNSESDNDGWSSSSGPETYEGTGYHNEAHEQYSFNQEKHLPPPPPPPAHHRPYPVDNQYSSSPTYYQPQAFNRPHELSPNIKGPPKNTWNSEYSSFPNQYQSDSHHTGIDSHTMIDRSSSESDLGGQNTVNRPIISSSLSLQNNQYYQQNSWSNLNNTKPVLEYFSPALPNQPISGPNSVNYQSHEQENGERKPYPEEQFNSQKSFGDRLESKVIRQQYHHHLPHHHQNSPLPDRSIGSDNNSHNNSGKKDNLLINYPVNFGYANGMKTYRVYQ